MTRASESPAATAGARPDWLENAPLDLKPLLEVGFEKYGDEPAAIAEWVGRLHDYKQFWSLVGGGSDALQERYARDGSLQSQIAEGRAHPERRVPRPDRRTA